MACVATLFVRSRYLIAVMLLALAANGPDWPSYGGGPDQTRYSPLTQITPANVRRLQVAWSYDTHDAFDGSEMQCQPVVAHGVLYATSPKLRVFALNAATGEQIWSFDPNEAPVTSRTRIRGLMYFERGRTAASTLPRSTGSTRSTRRPARRSRSSATADGSISGRDSRGARRAR